MVSKEILAAIVEDDATSLMEAFDKAIVEKISVLVEDRKERIASNILVEDDGGDDEENPDDEDMDWDDMDMLPLGDEDEAGDEETEEKTDDEDSVKE